MTNGDEATASAYITPEYAQLLVQQAMSARSRIATLPVGSKYRSAAGIVLYCDLNPCRLAISIALEEMGMPFKLYSLDCSRGEHLEDWYTDMCPNNHVPLMTDEGMPVFGTGAILLWLSNKCGRFHGEMDSRKHSEVMQWLMWCIGCFRPAVSKCSCCDCVFSVYILELMPYAFADGTDYEQ